MLKKFMCTALALIIMLCTFQTAGLAASYERSGLSASYVSFTDSGEAKINVKNDSAEDNSVVFWLGEYIDNVLVESDFIKKEIKAGQSAELELSVKKDDGSTLKAYIWEKSLLGKAIAPTATYPSSDLTVNYATVGGQIWTEFKTDVYEYDVVFARDVFDIPDFKLYARDNSARVVEPDVYDVGENVIEVIAADGSKSEYTINISYEAPVFTNISSPLITEDNVKVVPSEALTAENCSKEYMQGSDAYLNFPYKANDGSVKTRGSVTKFLDTLGHTEGELYVFKRLGSLENSSEWYAGGEGKYDGTNGKYFLSFDIEAAGTMYLYLYEGTDAANVRHFVEAGYEPHKTASKVYYKHYEAGETVEVPAMGWDSSWGNSNGDKKFTHTSYLLFGYDDINAKPIKYDETDVKLKSLTYTLGGNVYVVDGWSADDENGEYKVVVPTGTEKIDAVTAVRNENYSKVVIDKESDIALVEGKAEVTVKVTSKDGSVGTYTINFVEKEPEKDDATLKSISYTVGDTTYEIADFEAAVTEYEVTLPPFTSSVSVSALASVGNDKANVEVKQAVIEEKAGKAVIEVTAIDEATKLIYTINFTVETHISELPNKIYDLTKIASGGADIKSDNNAYQTETEATVANIGYMAIGENLSSASYRNYGKANKYTLSSDMAGATYIRTPAYYGSYKGYVTNGGDIIQRVYNADGSYTETTDTKFGNGATAGNLRVFNIPQTEFFNGTDGWLSFKVTDDCTVVIGDWSGFEPAYEEAGWTKSDKTSNYIGGTSYYKTFSAGDTVILPNYGLKGILADTTKVEYIYTNTSGSSVSVTTTMANTAIAWDGVSVAIKWAKTYSDNTALSDIKVNGVTVGGFDAEVKNYTVYAPLGGYVTVSAVAEDSNAKVYPAGDVIVNTGETQTFTVTAENGKTDVYTVTVEKEDTENTDLTALEYKIADGEWTAVEDFDNAVSAYSIPALTYSKNGTEVSIRGTAVSGSIGGTLNGTVKYGEDLTLTLTVTSKDETATSDYSVTFTMAELVFGAEIEATDEYKLMFADGKYDGKYVIKGDSAPTFETAANMAIASYDDEGRAKFYTYTIMVNGETYAEDGVTEFIYSKMMEIKEAEEDAGNVVSVASTGKFNYKDSYIKIMASTSFNSTQYYYGPVGSEVKNSLQVMTDRSVSGRDFSSLLSNGTYNSSATLSWFRNADGAGRLVKVTPNKKATVVVMNPDKGFLNLAAYENDGWTPINYEKAFSEALSSVSAENLISGVNKPDSMDTAWYMVKPGYVIENAPFGAVKIEYNSGSMTSAKAYVYGWYKVVEADESVYIPHYALNDQGYIKAFVAEGEVYVGGELPKDLSLAKIETSAGDAVLQSDGTYYLEVNSDTAEVTINAKATDSKASVTYQPSETVSLKAGKKTVVTVTVTNGESADYDLIIYRNVETQIGGTDDGGDY